MASNPEEEKKSNELAEKVEAVFPKEDANETQSPDASKPITNENGTPLWAKDQKDTKKGEEQKPRVSQTDVTIYMAREMHLMRIEMEAFLNKVFTMIPKNTISTPASTPTAPAPAIQEQKSEKQKQLENALVEWTNCNPVLIEVNTTESTMFYVVRFKQFLGSDNFAKISAACRALGGQYVSEGKQSHFNVPRQ